MFLSCALLFGCGPDDLRVQEAKVCLTRLPPLRGPRDASLGVQEVVATGHRSRVIGDSHLLLAPRSALFSSFVRTRGFLASALRSRFELTVNYSVTPGLEQCMNFASELSDLSPDARAPSAPRWREERGKKVTGFHGVSPRFARVHGPSSPDRPLTRDRHPRRSLPQPRIAARNAAVRRTRCEMARGRRRRREVTRLRSPFDQPFLLSPVSFLALSLLVR